MTEKKQLAFDDLIFKTPTGLNIVDFHEQMDPKM